METHTHILVWEIPWTEESEVPMGSQKSCTWLRYQTTDTSWWFVNVDNYAIFNGVWYFMKTHTCPWEAFKVYVFLSLWKLTDYMKLGKFSSVTQLCPTLCDPMDCSTPGFPFQHQLQNLLKLMSIELVMDREAWRAVVHGVTKTWTQLSDWTELTLLGSVAGVFKVKWQQTAEEKGYTFYLI